MTKQVIGRTVEPPKGWVFNASGILSPSGLFNAETFDTLYSWAKRKGYGLKPQGATPFSQMGWDIYCRYKVFTNAWDITETWLGDGTWGPGKVSLGLVECTHAGVWYQNTCASCSRAGVATREVGPNKTKLCSWCAVPCSQEKCAGWVSAAPALHRENIGMCETCCPRARCAFCAYWHPKEGMVSLPNELLSCKPCAEKRTCVKCKEIADRITTHNGERLCETCMGNQLDAERVPLEKFDSHELPIGESLSIASLTNRPVRAISIETEVDGDPIVLANTLYNEGIVREGYVESYGTPCPDGAPWPAFLKYDGSVSGGELIAYLIQMDNEAHADSLKNILGKMRSLEKLGKVEYNPNCGGHIHIDAHNFSTDNVWRLVTGYNYLEDVIFRLAGAGHAFGHRTLVPGHDAANNGHGYSHPTAKGPWGIKSNAYRAIAGQDRMTGLNFQPYTQAVYSCMCGAGPDNLRKCTCTLPKCTIEWRVWNSQGNPRILHGWIAFMQSLHAWADSAKEMTDKEEKTLPAFPWTVRKWDSTTNDHRKTAYERVEWIFSNLVFSDREKGSLIYAFQQTDMTFPAGFWTKVRQIPTPKNRTVKTPRNCTVRMQAIEVCKPERKVFGNPRHDPDYMGRRADRQPRFLDAAANQVFAAMPRRRVR